MSDLSRRRLLAAGGTALAGSLLLGPRKAHAATVLKLGSLAPEGSTWHKGLQKMAAVVAEKSGGSVELKIYAGGVAGNETVMLRKMRIGQLQAGAFTNIGLLEIDKSSQVVTIPMLVRNYDELDYVMQKMTPEFEKRIEAAGFHVLAWSEAGWSRLFTKAPLLDPSEVGKHKFFAWEGDPVAVEMYKAGGFNPIVVASTDVLPSLQTGLLDAFPGTPLSALALQWFALAPNMLDLPWAPLMAGIVVSKAAWDTIPADLRGTLDAEARRIGGEMRAEVRRQDTKAIEVMTKYGLKVNKPDAATVAKWTAKAQSVYPLARQKMVPPEIYDQVTAHLAEYRKAHP